MKIKSFLLLGGIVLLWLPKSQANTISYLGKKSKLITSTSTLGSARLNKFKDILIKGQITDKSGPVPGASISLKSNPNIGTSTDSNGNFAITAPENGILIIKSIGYKTKEVPVQGKTTLTITLEEENNNLSDVVVVGYSSKKQGELSSSVSVISAEKLKGVASNDIISMIQGKAPGVVVSSGSGDPTAAPSINIRGVSSINGGTAPLLVVDGNILGAYGSEGATYSPADVESVTILKDAAATGLYGSRAGSGVIIVTTKTGKAGESKIEFNSTIGFSTPTTGNFKLMNTQQLYDYQKTFSNPKPSVLGTDTDWWDLATQNGMTQNYTLSASGGSEKVKYYIAGNYYREQGTVVNNDKSAYNLRANLNSQLTK
jgi:TonB-dependent SusC/RagA subfamily outer membrane receptor